MRTGEEKLKIAAAGRNTFNCHNWFTTITCLDRVTKEKPDH